jgi:hypothetical protein
MDEASSVRLLEVEPELARFLGREQRAAARALKVPAHTLATEETDLLAMLREFEAFTAIVLSGMLLTSTQLGEHRGARVLGPGDHITRAYGGRSMLVSEPAARVVMPTKVALLGREFLFAVHRWPALAAGLHVRTADQVARLSTQMLICQLPRVEDRLMAMLWLLSETWGQVTPSGTVLPISLTHGLLGGLVGAQRSTVTLALQQLTDAGHLIRQDRGWLLLTPPSEPPSDAPFPYEQPRVIASDAAEWRIESLDATDLRQEVARAALRDSVTRLRHEHLIRAEEIRSTLDRMTASRNRSSEIRRGITRRTVSR